MADIVVDSGPLIALFDGSDQFHQQAVAFIKARFPETTAGPGGRQRLVTNLPVVTEVVYVLDFSPGAERDFLAWIELALTLDTDTPKDLPRIRSLMAKYADLSADFADASLVALCERLGTTSVASVDSDSTIYRTASRQVFRNLFFEP